MDKLQKITMIGAGNVAWHLSQALESVGCIVQEVYSKSGETAQKLTKKLYDASLATSLDFRGSDSQLFVIAISDDAIAEVAAKMRLPEGAALVHTSGSVPLASLAAFHPYSGVFYPLQTFSKNKRVDFKKIPICIESGNGELAERLSDLACLLSDHVYEVSSEERKVLHLGAVIACNFTNHLWAMAEEITRKAGLDFAMLHPLLRETLAKAIEIGAGNAQTGPAVRRDHEVISEHLSMLKQAPDWNRLYLMLTKSIQDFQQEEKE